MTPCGHTRHVGTCPHCQRAQLARWRAQLLAASTAKREPGPAFAPGFAMNRATTSTYQEHAWVL
jgi:hypothetical protein